MNEEQLLKNCVGKTILHIDYTGKYSASVTFTFTDNTTLTIDAEGDDMAHTVISN